MTFQFNQDQNLGNIGFSKEFVFEVIQGNIKGYEFIFAKGERESTGTTSTGEDIWRGNELTPAANPVVSIPSSSGEQMSVVSESAQDNPSGTGIGAIDFEYIDIDGIQKTENVILNGLTPVDFVATNILFLNDHCASSVGSSGAAVGNIKIYKKSDTTVIYGMTAIGGNKSLLTNRMVPIDKKMLLLNWRATEAQNKRAAIRIRSTDNNGMIKTGIFCFKDVTYLKQGASGDLPLAVLIPPLSIIKVTAWVVVAGAEVSASWVGLLIDNDI